MFTILSLKMRMMMVVADPVRFGGSGRAKRFREFGSSCEGHTVNALASGGDEGRRSLR